ncbi:ABC transporter ATP-binding protein [Eubacterium sp.]|uniref:ABC transporter ATP-binding protein n=1 Tax=Eubacterium sp. TaxID=142586 RepID=UPI0025C63E34|nr:ABC transporter ATP-binding protein [Eubacterium sp.]
MKEKKESNFSRLIDYAENYRYFTYISLLLSAVSSALALLPFYYIWKIIKEVLEVMPNFENAAGIVKNGVIAVVFAVLSMIIYIASLMCSHTSAFRVQANMRKQMMHKIVQLPLGEIEKFGSGKLRKIVNDCSAATETYLAHQLPDMVGSIITPIGLLVFLLAFDWRFGLISLIPIVLSFVIMMAFMTGKTLQQKMAEYQNALDDMSNEAVEYVRGIPVVKAFGQSVFSFRKFKKSIDSYSEWAIDYTKNLRIPMAMFTMLINGIFAFIIFGGLIFAKGGVTNDLILNILFYVIITPILTVTMTKIMFQSENKMIVADAFKRIDSVMNISPLEATKCQKPTDASVQLKNVSYSYDGEIKAIDDVSLDIKSGQTVAFVGPSGGGKTTLANLITRFFDADSGEVLVGGVNVKNIAKEDLTNAVSYVFQDSKLIAGSIFDNVRLSKPNADMDEVMSALEKAQCMDIIEKFDSGVDTVIGSNGVYLSGGEAQRIAIARAILKNAPIVILDEATAFADPDNEVKIQKALNELSKSKTVIMIAHRLSTVQNADCIYVLKDGRLIEQGKSGELCKQNGVFATMLENYLTSVKWKVAKEELK